MEYYGNARNVKKLTWNIYDMGAIGGTDQTVYLGKNLYSRGYGNLLPVGVTSRVSLSALVPTDIDVSFPVKIVMSAVGTVVGSFQLTVRYNFSNTGSDLYLTAESAPEVTSGENSVAKTQVVAAIGKEVRVEIPLNICHINMNPSGLGPQTLWLSIERPNNDGFAGDVVLGQVSGYYVSWIDGAHLLAY
jgi:hypothetical protein